MTHSITMRGKRWRVQFVSPKAFPCDYDGVCDRPDAKNKRIQISDELTGRDLLETTLHETLHAGCWDLREEVVEEIAAAQARLLWKLGVRFAE